MDKHGFSILRFIHICLAFAYVQHANALTISTTATTTTNRYTTVQTTNVAQSTSINSIPFPSTTKAVGSTPTMLAQTTTAASLSTVAQTTIKSQSTIVSPTATVSSVTQTTTVAPSTTTFARMTTVIQTMTTTVAGTGTTASNTSPASPSTISLASTTTAPAITVTSPTSRPLTSYGVPTTLTTNVLPTTKGDSATTADISTTTKTLHYCLSNPCQNGGTCSENATMYTCNCIPGYTNASCEIEINECATLPCYSFGRCTDKINDYSCSCNAGFTPGGITDKLCNEIDECRTNNVSCQNNGICHDYINTFQCQCPLAQDGTAKYYGNFCEKEIKINPQISGVSKTFGILSGGAALTFYGTDLDKLPPFGVNFTNGIGKPLFGYVQAESIQPTSFVVLTPKARDDLIDVELMLVVIFSGGASQNLTLKYHYVANPRVVNITPRVQLATGGILLTVMGTNLDAAVTAIMTVNLQLFNHGSLISTQSYRQVCSALNGTAMNCRLPYFDLPPTFFDTNATQKPVVKRRRREIQSTSAAALKLFHSLKNFLGSIYTVVFRDERSADTFMQVKKLRRRRSGPTASLNASDGTVAKMYLGFIFDNDPTYENISKSLPNITFNLITQGPRFSPTDNEQDQVFDPNKQEPLQIKAKNLTLGCSKSDYNVSVGAGVCNVSELTDNVLTCFPPVETPPVDEDTLKNCRSNDDDSNHLAVMVRVSKFEYFAFCVQYSEADSMNWVIGVCVGCGCGLLLLLLTVAVSVKIHGYMRKRKSRTSRPGIDPPPEPNRVYGRQRGQSGSNGDHGPTLTRDASLVEMRSYRSGRSRAFGIAPFLAFGKRISYTRQNPDRDNGNRYYDTQVIPENDNNNDHDYSAQTPSHLRRMTDASTEDNSRPRVGSPEVEKWSRRPAHRDDDGRRGMQGGSEQKWKFNYPNVDSEDSTSLSKDYLNHTELTNKGYTNYERHAM